MLADDFADKFRRFSITMEETKFRNPRVHNRAFEKQRALVKSARRIDTNAVDQALLDLLDDPEPCIQYHSAFFLLSRHEDIALSILERSRISDKFIEFEARLTAEEWRKGNLYDPGLHGERREG